MRGYMYKKEGVSLSILSLNLGIFEQKFWEGKRKRYGRMHDLILHEREGIFHSLMTINNLALSNFSRELGQWKMGRETQS